MHLTAIYTNTGQVPYNGISVVSPRADTSDDTIPTGDQVASSGDPGTHVVALTWTGSIPVGGVVPRPTHAEGEGSRPGQPDHHGHRVLEAPGNNCTADSTDPRCTFTVPVLTPELTISTTSDTSFVAPGDSVEYTTTIRNTGETPYAGAVVRIDLTGLLDDATYDANATSTSGSVAYASPVLTWTGNLAVNASVALTYSVTAHQPATGDKAMVTIVTSTAVGNSCPPPGGPTCRTTVLVLTPGLTITSAANVATSVPGATISYTIAATNTGQIPLVDAGFHDRAGGRTGRRDLQQQRDGDRRSGGSRQFRTQLGGDPCARAGHDDQIHRDRGQPGGGNSQLEQTVISTDDGSTCPTGSTGVPCATTVPIAGLKILHAADASVTAPTKAVRYTSTFTNTGKVPYVGISITLT